LPQFVTFDIELHPNAGTWSNLIGEAVKSVDLDLLLGIDIDVRMRFGEAIREGEKRATDEVAGHVERLNAVDVSGARLMDFPHRIRVGGLGQHGKLPRPRLDRNDAAGVASLSE